MLRTCLHQRHTALGAKMADFAGWEMPISYSSALKEHEQVRTDVGMFDISHMGRLEVTGEESTQFLNDLVVTELAQRGIGRAVYTVMCKEDGRALEDLILYRQGANEWSLIVNAANRVKVHNHLMKYAKDRNVTIRTCYEGEGILAIQGPNAETLLKILIPGIDSLKKMAVTSCELFGAKGVVARSGYTGEDGFEIYAKEDQIVKLWDWLTERGVAPIGLAARDSLRLEMGYTLYGHELSEQIYPFESPSGSTISQNKQKYLGRESIEAVLKSQKRRWSAGLTILDRSIPRAGDEVRDSSNHHIGIVTSGGYSPTDKRPICLLLLDREASEGEELSVVVRGKTILGVVKKPPFIRPLA